MASLADAVLPLIRTRADLHRLGAANAHGRQMHQGVDVLEAAIPGTDPSPVYTVTHKALASAVKVIARADDPSGVIGDACRRLLALHPQVAARAGVPAVRLADWMITFQFAWHELITSYEKIDPLAVLPIHAKLAEKDLEQADAKRYRQAARRLATMRAITAGTSAAADIDAMIRDHRETHRRRPRLQQEFDRAGLP